MPSFCELSLLEFARMKLSAQVEHAFDPPLPDFTVFVRRDIP